jgi:hypothetical protein
MRGLLSRRVATGVACEHHELFAAVRQFQSQDGPLLKSPEHCEVTARGTEMRRLIRQCEWLRNGLCGSFPV